MAEKIVTYPEVNPLQMVKENYADLLTTTKYKFPHYNEWWQCERRAMHEPITRYHQKIQQTDRLILVFHSNNAGTTGATFKIYNNDWTDTGVVVGVTNTSVSGFEITSEVTNTDYTAYTHIVDGTIASLGLSDGKYFGVMEVPFASGDPVYYISEPIYLRDQHPKTHLLEYTNSVNNFDVFFATHNISFQLRVESHLFNLTPNSIDTTYEDELVDTTLLDSVPYNTYTLAFRGIPEWMVNKVNRAFSCDRLRWEGKYFNKDKEAKFDYIGTGNEPLKGISIAVRPSKNRYSQQNIFIDGVLVWEIENNGDSGGSTRFPYFVRRARLTRTAAPDVILMEDLNGVNGPFPYTTDCLEVRSVADELILLNHANNVTRLMYGQLGYYAYVPDGSGGTGLYYFPHPTEQNYTGNSSIVLSRHFVVSFENGAYGNGQFYDITGSWIGYALVRQNNTHANAGYGNGNIAFNYLVGGSSINLIGDNARVYHYIQATSANTIARFNAIYDSDTPNITGFTGKLPPGLAHFRVMTSSSGSFTVLDWAIFDPCKATIFSIEAFNNQIFAQGNLTTFAGQEFTTLQYIDLSVNDLPATGANGVDAFFIAMWGGGGAGRVYAVTGMGDVSTFLQLPSIPTGASAAARAGIAGDGWNITHDT